MENKMETKKVKINTEELAFLISNKNEFRLSEACITANSSGSLYFDRSGLEVGDDAVIFSFLHCDVNLSFGHDLIEWLKDTYSPSIGLDEDGEEFVCELH